MKTHVKRNPLTTIAGGAIILICLALVYLGKATFTEISGFVTLALGVLVSKDELFKQNFLNK